MRIPGSPAPDGHILVDELSEPRFCRRRSGESQAGPFRNQSSAPSALGLDRGRFIVKRNDAEAPW